MQLIEVLFGIEIPIRTVGEYLLRWGWTPHRSIKRALEQNPVKVEQWLNDTYPTVAARAKAEGAANYWCGETAVAEDGHWIRGYAPAAQTPVLVALSKRHGLSMVFAISNLVTAWLPEHKDGIKVFYLPPYFPEINPDEYLNRDFKTVLRSSDRAESKKALLQGLRTRTE